jgi:hypothetical protein
MPSSKGTRRGASGQGTAARVLGVDFAGAMLTLGLRKGRDAQVIPFEHEAGSVRVAVIRVDYTQGTPDTYVWPLTFATDVNAVAVQGNTPHAVVAELEVTGRDGVPVTGFLYDAMEDPTFCAALLDAIGRRRRFKGPVGELASERAPPASRPGRRCSRRRWSAASKPRHLQPVDLEAVPPRREDESGHGGRAVPNRAHALRARRVSRADSSSGRAGRRR